MGPSAYASGARNHFRVRTTDLSQQFAPQVFTSASCAVLSTFPCDDNVVGGESYLIADYSISCQTRVHSFFKAYAAFMILVS